MAIDYVKRSSRPLESPTRIVLTKTAPSVSLTKHASSSGFLRVNLNWNANAYGSAIDLDLGCLYEFTDRSKGVVQALGNAFNASPRGVRAPVIRLDGDDRSGSNSAGENLFIDLSAAHRIRRILIFALIYDGVPNWSAADAVVTLFPTSGPPVEVRLDDARDGARVCGIAMLRFDGVELSIRREVNYIVGSQSDLDREYGWGMRWTRGRK